jgi:hypothetical protein
VRPAVGIARNPAPFWTAEDMKEYQDMLAQRGARQGAVPALKRLPAWMPQESMLPGPLLPE